MKFSTTLVLPVLLAGLPLSGTAADNPYAGQEQRPIKALSGQEISDYLSGRGMGTSKAAELNHYPGPRHVLDHADQLRLSQDQLTKAQEIHDAMVRDAKDVGQKIVAKEAELEALYASRKANPENTQRTVQELAGLQGQFRLAHLNAHLSMKDVLSPQQIETYDRVRGYDGTKPMHQGRMHH